jgi:membrane fusion protein (multidrug efflux system)
MDQQTTDRSAGVAAPAATPTPGATPTAGARRKRLFTILGVVVLVVAVLWFFYWLLIGSHRISTDDAYVQADVAQVTALVGGPIVGDPVGETQTVQKGQVVAVIDPADYRLAVLRAEAQLGQAERRVQQYYANEAGSAAQATARGTDVARAQAQLDSARSDLARAESEYTRRRSLAGTGAVSGDELTQAQNARQTAQASVTAAQAALAQARANVTVANAQQRSASALVQGSDARSNPEVAAARAQLDQARLDLERSVVRAPVTGVVTKKTLEIGQRVQPGAQLMNIVPIQSAFVDANFKEVQLRKIRIGAPVILESDLYGGGVKFHGRVIGVSGGSGSAFSLIPAQNATGNWIKVVQRVPVRIGLDPAELKQHPLRVGLSMKAVVRAP